MSVYPDGMSANDLDDAVEIRGEAWNCAECDHENYQSVEVVFETFERVFEGKCSRCHHVQTIRIAHDEAY